MSARGILTIFQIFFDIPKLHTINIVFYNLVRLVYIIVLCENAESTRKSRPTTSIDGLECESQLVTVPIECK